MMDRLVLDNVIPPELRPQNGRRFAENLRSIINLDKYKLADAIDVVRRFYLAQANDFPRSVTLHQLAIVALKRASMLRVKRSQNKKHYYITDGMISLFPDAKELLPRVFIE
jgi:hypothetical protein